MRCESLQLRVQTCQLQLCGCLFVLHLGEQLFETCLWTVLKFIKKKRFYEKSKDFMKMKMEMRKRKK